MKNDTMDSVPQALPDYAIQGIEAETLREASDWKLLRLISSGSSEAFEELFARYETRLIAYGTRYVASADLAKDVCQEVFLKLIKTPPRIRISKSLAPWLFRVTRNLAIDKRRSRKFEIRESDADMPEPQAEGNPLLCLSQKTDAELVRQLIAELPKDLRDVVNLRIYGEVPFKDIAVVLSIPQGTALWRMHRAVQLLRQRWRRHEEQV